MNIVIWIIIIFVAIFLIRLLKKWIRRLIFIAILLIIAFFIYGLFSPTGASKLWYNVRTFPDRIVSRFSNKSFIDYDTYKLDFSSIGTKDKSDLDDTDSDVNHDLDTSDSDIDLDIENDHPDTDIEIIENNEDIELSENKTSNKNVIKSFGNISSLKFVNMKEKLSKEPEIKQDVSGYSKSDLLGIISNYIENNLKDDNEILVTIEYSETGEADKIVLKVQPKRKSTDNVLSIPRLSLEKMIDGIYKSKYETVVVDSDINESVSLDYDTSDLEDIEKVKENKESDLNSQKDSSSNNDLVVEVKGKNETQKESTPVTQTVTQKTTQTQTKRKTSNGLSQKDIRDAEEVLGALF